MVKINVSSKTEKYNGMSFGVFYTHADRGTPRKSGVTDDANNDRLPTD